jgi:hypothetical protein
MHSSSWPKLAMSGFRGTIPSSPRDAVEFELLAFTGDGRGGEDHIFDTFGIAGRVAEGKVVHNTGFVPHVIWV